MQEDMIAYVFPGAGIPFYKGIKNFHKEHSDIINLRFYEASDHLHIDLLHYITDEFSAINLGEIKSQLFFYTFSSAIMDILNFLGQTPKYVTGYSMGMFTALFASGAIKFTDGLEMLKTLDNLVTKISYNKEYSLIAVLGIMEEELKFNLDKAEFNIDIINQNSNTSFILCGHTESIDKFIELIINSGAIVSKLSISAPYHTNILSGLEKDWDTNLSRYDFNDPEIPIICSATQEIILNGKNCRNIALKNVYTHFSWIKTIEKLETLGINHFFECGPSVVLSKMGKFIRNEHVYYNIKNFEFQGRRN